MLHESFYTTVIIEASSYYQSVQFLIWVLIDNITEIYQFCTSIGVYTTLYLALVYLFGRRSNQDRVRAAGGEEGLHQMSHSRSLLTFKTQEIALKMKSVIMVQLDVMKEDGWHQNMPFTEPANIQEHKKMFQK